MKYLVQIRCFHFLCLFLCLTLVFETAAQVSYPKDYFIFPYQPGTKASLTGNMGELRSNHFHGGLDIRTNYVVGKPIVAAADGYVSLLQQDTQGYGNMVILTHPNGLKTVYAHLQSFHPALEAYIRKKQYELERFQVELTPPKALFKFKKGEVLGLGGNTGSSGGPHLHFEIRDSADGIINPLIVGFPEVQDKMAPYFARMAIRPLDINSRVEGTFDRLEFGVKKVGNRYVAEKTLSVWGHVGLEAYIRDRINNGSHRAGVNCVEIKLDGKVVYYYNQSHLPLSEAKQINNHLVYDHYVRSGDRYQKCYIADGSELLRYRNNDKTGRMLIRDSQRHQVLVHLTDAHGNETELEITLVGKPPQAPQNAATAGGSRAKFRTELHENVLKIRASNLPSGTSDIVVMSNRKAITCPLAYNDDNAGVFLYDMRKGLPDSLMAPNGVAQLNFKATIVPGRNLVFKGRQIEIDFSEENLYDTLYLEVEEDLKEKTVKFGHGTIPLHGPVMVTLKPFEPVDDLDHTGAAQILNSKGAAKFAGGRWTPEGAIKFKTKYFGTYGLVKDTKAPTIQKLVTSRDAIRLIVKDNLAGIHSWRATLNGKWLLLCYEHKHNELWAEPLVKGTPLSGELVVEVKDGLGNVAKYEARIP